MVNTGIIRKIDGLGRIVIPKDIREQLHLKENDYLEFLVFQEGFTLKKYSKIGRLQGLAQELTDTLNHFLDAEVLIADRDKILAYSGKERAKYLNQDTSIKLAKAIRRRESLFEPYRKELEIINGEVIECSYINETIISDSEEAGIITLYRTDKSVSEEDLKIVGIVADFLTKYLEQ